ncbi:MAG: hypothetical protein Q7K42_05195 [Candidatus Diapherotrites archaeon]|nr:hypothetical protein [Candidatus Diapherotrites archaeon]
MVETKTMRDYVIPLDYAKTANWTRRTHFAISVIRRFVVRHTKNPNISISQEVNELIWSQSKYKCPKRVKVTTKLFNGKMKVYLQGSKLIQEEEELLKKQKSEEKKKGTEVAKETPEEKQKQEEQKKKTEEKKAKEHEQRAEEKKAKEQAHEKEGYKK